MNAVFQSITKCISIKLNDFLCFVFTEETDMRKLQQRLAETEAQMTKILAAMQMVQSRAGDLIPDGSGGSKKSAPAAADERNNQEQESAETEDKVRVGLLHVYGNKT